MKIKIYLTTQKYCNKCGSFLKLAKKEIQYKPQKYKTMQLLKETLIEGSRIINKDKNDNLSTTHDISIYHSLIWYYLLETTNIKDKLKDITEKTFTESIIKLLDDLKSYPKKDILNEFLYRINVKYEENKSIPKIERKFIFYTNIKLKENNKNKFNEILPLFNLKIFNYEDYNFKEYKEMSEKFKSDYLLLEHTTQGKNASIMKNNALNKLYLFFGYLTFLANFHRFTEKYHINELSLNHSISDLKISSIIELDKNNSLGVSDNSCVILFFT